MAKQIEQTAPPASPEPDVQLEDPCILPEEDDLLDWAPDEEDEDKMRLGSVTRRFLQPHVFKPGQMVQWKKGLRNRRHPVYCAPAIVVEVLDPPLMEPEENSGSPNYGQPLSLKLGVLGPDVEFLVYHYDGRRFEPYIDDVEPA